MANLADRYQKRDAREFQQLAAAIIYHHAPADLEPSDRNPYVCPGCRHAVAICTCEGSN